jgi:hypothetical protein
MDKFIRVVEKKLKDNKIERAAPALTVETVASTEPPMNLPDAVAAALKYAPAAGGRGGDKATVPKPAAAGEGGGKATVPEPATAGKGGDDLSHHAEQLARGVKFKGTFIDKNKTLTASGPAQVVSRNT